MNDFISPPGGERPAAPRPTGTRGTLFDSVFLGTSGVRAGWRAAVYVAVVLVLIAAGQLAGSVLRLPLNVNARDLTPTPIFLQELLLFSAALAASWLLGLIECRSIGDYGLPWRGALRGLFWQGAGWGFGEISLLVLLIATLGGYRLSAGSSGPAVVGSGIVWFIVFLFVGLAEEFVFRGYLLTTLTEGIGFWPAALLLSVAFGAVHMGNPGETYLGLATVVLVGVFFCLTVRRTGTLWFAVGAHAAHDFAQAFIYSLPNSGTVIRNPLLASALSGPDWLTGGAVGPEGSVVELAVLALVIALFARVYPGRPMQPGIAPEAE